MAINGIRANFFPYCMKRQEDGSWVLLNRNYKPIGFNTDEYVIYDQHPVSIKLKGLREKTLKALSCDGELSDNIFLYNDSCTPSSSTSAMTAYLKKLEILLKIKNN